MQISFRPRSTLTVLIAALVLLVSISAAFALGSAPQKDNAPQSSSKASPASAPATLHLTATYITQHHQGILRFTFNKPMLPNDSKLIGTTLSAENSPVVFNPPLPGEALWTDQHTLSYITYSSLPKATEITISPRGELKSVDGTAFKDPIPSWTPFPLSFQAWQTRYSIDGTVTLTAQFSATMDLAKLKDTLIITDAKKEKKYPFELEPINNEAGYLTKAKIFVKPDQLGTLLLTLPEGSTSASGPTGLSKSRCSVTVETTSMLFIRSVRSQQSTSPPWKRYISVQTTNSVDMDKVKQFLDITPATDIQIVADSSGFSITGDFFTRPRVTLTFKKGMPGLLGVLAEDFSSTVIFNDFSPRMAFDGDGTILSPNRTTKIPLSSINVEKVQATLWQLPENNLPLMAMGFFGTYKKHLSKKIAVKEGVTNAVRNTECKSSIDLAQIADKAKGVFLLTLSDASDPKKITAGEPTSYGEDDDYYSYSDTIAQKIEKLVVISDIGITARIMPGSATVWVNSITTTDPIRNAHVKIFTANNVLLAEGRTDSDGLWRHTRPENWKGRERPAIVVVSANSTDSAKRHTEPGLSDPSYTDVNVLKFESNLNSDATFDTGGSDYLQKGYEAFCFTPRGVFRPGETVDFKVLVRDSRMKAPEKFPVAWLVRASTGRTVGKGTAMLNNEGGGNFSLPLVNSSPTGRYTMTVSLPGQNKILGMCAFSVEDFQPPRIEVVLTPEKPFASKNEPITINLDAKYLFGSPVADAPWESEVSVRPGTFSHPDWRTFFFPSALTQNGYIPKVEKNGVLDGKGLAFVTISPTDEWTASMLNVTASIKVREDGGRWVARNITVPYFKTGNFIGYEFSNNEPQAGKPYPFRVAAVDPNGKAAAFEDVKVLIKRRENYYARTDKGYTYSTRYVPVEEISVKLTNGIGIVNFTPPQQANYNIYIEDPTKETLTTATLGVWSGIAGSDDGASPLIDRVMLSWEKPKYQIGETAALKVRSPFPGKLLVTVESDKEIYRMVVPMKETETTLKIPVLSSMLPNAYCTAWVIRPVKEDEAWGAHRAYGVAPLLIDQSYARIAVDIKAPENALPKSDLPVSVTLKDGFGQPVRGEVTLALVDEGLLSLTNYTTPNPFAFFTAKRAMQSLAFDIYDYLMPLSTRKAISLQAGGDAAGDSGSQLSPFSRKLEVLSIFLGTLPTDSHGLAQTTLTLPEYSGKGRLMAIASTKSGIGSAAENIRIARKVTVEATVPRMVAPGDTFFVPVVVLGEAGKTLQASISIKTEGSLAIEGPKSFTVQLSPSKPKAEFPLAVKALDMSGIAALTVVTRIEGNNEMPFEQRLEIPVRPPFPRVVKHGSGIVKGGDQKQIEIIGDFLPGTQKLSLSFSDTPGIGLMKALDYLGSYPYGCLEQTTSTAWPYLAVPILLKSIDPEKAKDSEFKQGLNYAIRRILSMQKGEGGFSSWPGMHASSHSAWGAVYATHFLTEAKSTGLVPEDALSTSLDWMRSYLTSPLPDTRYGVIDALSVKAYVCYVLALNGDAPLGWMQFLKDQGKFLSQSAQIFLAGAYAIATGKTDTLKELGTLPFPRTERYGWSLESVPRNEALRLLMWASVDPFAPETAELAKRVINDGNTGKWRSTQENAMAVMSIGRYVEKTSGESRDFTATLSTVAKQGEDTKEIMSFTNKDAPTLSRENIPPAQPTKPDLMKLAVQGEGTVFYSWTTSGVPVTAPEPFAKGISVFRRWVLPDGTVYDFVPDEKGVLPQDLRTLHVPQGTRITVTLYIKPSSGLNSMILADIIPGGFEIDNPNLLPDSEFAARAGTFIDPKTHKPFIQPTGFKHPLSLNAYDNSRTEMRDDRLLLFVDQMPETPSIFTYTLRAITKGQFVLPPIAVEDMYDPSIQALSPTAKVEIN